MFVGQSVLLAHYQCVSTDKIIAYLNVNYEITPIKLRFNILSGKEVVEDGFSYFCFSNVFLCHIAFRYISNRTMLYSKSIILFTQFILPFTRLFVLCFFICYTV